jgi:hypothetical protein
MFWFELIVMAFILYYTDILFDSKQLVVFFQSGLYGYFGANICGIIFPAVVAYFEILAWLRTPDSDYVLMRMPFAVAALLAVLLVGTQTHVLTLTLVSAFHLKKHPLLQKAKQAEFVESAVSPLVQLHCILCYFCHVEQIRNSIAEESAIYGMMASVVQSMLSLGLALALRDKSDTEVLGLYGRINGWSSPDLYALLLTRSLEVASRTLSFSLVCLSVRGPLLAQAMAALLTLYGSMVLLAFGYLARPPDVFTAMFAHPGQLLENSSILPLWRSIAVQLVLSLAAGVLQFLTWQGGPSYIEFFPDCKPAPMPVLAIWLLATGGSLCGLIALNWYSKTMAENPYVEEVLKLSGGGCVKLSKLVRIAGGSVGRAVWRALPANKPVLVDTNDLDYLTSSDDLGGACGWLRSEVHLMLARASQSGALEVVQRTVAMIPPSQVTGLDVACCFQYDSDDAIAEELLTVVASSSHWTVLSFARCIWIPANAWKTLSGCSFPELKKADLAYCFLKQGEGAETAFEVLARSTQLEEINLDACIEIPAEAWERVPAGCWPQLARMTWPRTVPAQQKDRILAGRRLLPANNQNTNQQIEESLGEQGRDATNTEALQAISLVSTKLVVVRGMMEERLSWTLKWIRTTRNSFKLPNVKIAIATGCFDVQAEAAEDLLGILTASTQLEELMLQFLF